MLLGVEAPLTPVPLDGKPYAKLAAVLRRYRERAGLTQAALSRLTPLKPTGRGHVVGSSHIALIETGDRGARPPTIDHLAKALGLSAEERQEMIDAAGYGNSPGGAAAEIKYRADFDSALAEMETRLQRVETLMRAMDRQRREQSSAPSTDPSAEPGRP